jgi:hypothetical protein
MEGSSVQIQTLTQRNMIARSMTTLPHALSLNNILPPSSSHGLYYHMEKFVAPLKKVTISNFYFLKHSIHFSSRPHTIH